MPKMMPQQVRRGSSLYPPLLGARLGVAAPEAITIFGPSAPVADHMVALFCSRETPGATILKALDQAAKWRDQGVCVISGFHSPLERECFVTLLRGRQPIVMAVARATSSPRLDPAGGEAFNGGRLTILAPASGHGRTTAQTSHERNRLVAALADETVFAYIKPGGSLARLAHEVETWGGEWRQLTTG